MVLSSAVLVKRLLETVTLLRPMTTSTELSKWFPETVNPLFGENGRVWIWSTASPPLPTLALNVLFNIWLLAPPSKNTAGIEPLLSPKTVLPVKEPPWKLVIRSAEVRYDWLELMVRFEIVEFVMGLLLPSN